MAVVAVVAVVTVVTVVAVVPVVVCQVGEHKHKLHIDFHYVKISTHT